MYNLVYYITSFFLLGILCHHVTLSERRCRCLSNDPKCWPNTAAWQRFNASINGRLISARPSAAVCNSNPPDVDACATATTEWPNPFWRGDQAGALQNHNWENSSCSVKYNSTTCNQGSVPILAVNATLPEHIQTTIHFVKTHNLRLVMKTSGHDYFGRSTAFGSLLLWLHHMKNKTLIDSFSTCSGESISNAIRLDAGVQWGEVYRWLAPYNLVAIGGASGTVGATGGFLQGGGHGPLTRWKGLAADQVIEFEVVMADGRREKVNACENRDLFWALRGGGGGTFAVVISVVLRTHPSPSVVASIVRVSSSDENRLSSYVRHLFRMLPVLADAGWSGYFYLKGDGILTAFLLPNGNIDVADATITQLTNNYTDLNINVSLLIPYASFNEFYVEILEPTNPTGGNVLPGSRLVPETIVRNQSDQLADKFFEMSSHDGVTIVGHLVAGGQVSNTTQNNSVNSAWRTALLHMIYARDWPDGTSAEDQQKLARGVTEQIAILETVAGGPQSGAYINEGDPNEPNWQQKFFGTIENYNRLKIIKNSVDPNGLFVCKVCVGSDDWSEDLNCPKVSNAKKVDITLKLSLLIGIYYLLFS